MNAPLRTAGTAGNIDAKRVIERAGVSYPVYGSHAPDFAPVLDAFAENFATEEEHGAAAAVYVDGQLVADCWGGWKDTVRTIEWERDTIVNTMSVTKTLAAACVHILVDREHISLDAPVANYWPEFGAAGKQDMPVRYLLDHRAGLPYIENAPAGLTVFDWDGMVAALAAARPVWEPGKQAGYHVLSQGHLLGELVRRVDGRSIGRFFADEIAAPLGLDFFIGVPEGDLVRCADYLVERKGTILDRDALDPTSILARSWEQVPKDTDFNGRDWRMCAFPSGNGHGSARAVARFFACLANGGELDGVRILSQAAVDTMLTEQHNMVEVVMQRSYHQALGVLLNSPPIVWMGPHADAFGHHGVGGSIGMGERLNNVAISYLPSRMHNRLDNGPRARRIIEATYACL
ncbi:MAG: serine hydrolase domain-containing protein [Mesorhizobium sp.]